MAEIKIKDADGNDIYIKTSSGTGVTGDPFVPEQMVEVSNLPATQPVSGTVSVTPPAYMSTGWLQAVAQGDVPGYSLVNKFGYNGAVGSTLSPVSPGGIYQTPTSAATLEVVSDDSDDTSAGTGARVITVEGLDDNFDMQSVDVTTNGTSAVVMTGTWRRVFRAYVKESGTYASSSAGSHAGTITVRTSGGGTDWATINMGPGGFPVGQTEIGVYTVPAGYTGYLLGKHMVIESTKVPDLLWFKREGADDTTAPYNTLRLFERQPSVANSIMYKMPAPHVVVPEKTDIGAMAYVATGVAAVTVEFQILLVQNP